MPQAANTQVTIDQEVIDPKKDKYVSFRLLLSEVSELKSMAQAENKNVSCYIRSRIFSPKNVNAA
ncbi:hypothetical protein [Pseudanabaena sp. ABRG5-3]|uniref:hypothetical protein n=1 Tax=Pseudanabaena sp. ABRG5-3 TaxID=685565 RepID=UPI000DC6D48E|nr:hypothetical protein [Pseudanabaena sp. ABRG5-3]BBC27233.1 hypothetical protein ABRG53_g007 [Pseudanabaena sp. ABRG5-3]